MKVAKASVISVLLGLLLFYAVPQVQDLFLEVSGTAKANLLFWVTFYVAILIGWVLPVYVCSSWILSKFRGEESRAGPAPVKEWVRRVIPPFLAVLCLAAVLAGQMMSVSNAPTNIVPSDIENKMKELRKLELCDVRKCGLLAYMTRAAEELGLMAIQFVGAERATIYLYTVFAVILIWLLVRPRMRTVPWRVWRIALGILWWLATFIIILPIAFAAIGATYGLARQDLQQKLNLGHLLVLPIATVLIAWLVWRALRARSGEQTPPGGRLLMRLIGKDRPADQAALAENVLKFLFGGTVAVSVAIVATLLFVHPAEITRHIYRALMVPFLLGFFVPALTYLSYWSVRWQAPLITAIVVLVALLAARFADTHDMRITASEPLRPTLDESVKRWATVNDCELEATDEPGRYTAPRCPAPIIISAAGGASRAAFLSGSVIGKLLDEPSAAVLEGHEGGENPRMRDGVWSAAFNPDGRRVITVGSDNTAHVWDAATGNEISALVGHSNKLGVSLKKARFNANGRRVLTVSNDDNARLWDTESGEEITVLEARDGLTKHAEFSPDGRRVVAAISNGTARVWDVESGKLVAILKGHKAALWSASFSADSRRIVTTAEDGTARIWDADSAKEIDVLGDPADKRVLSASFSPDGQRVITKHAGAIARLWDLQSGRQIAAMKGDGGWSLEASFSPDGRHVVTTSGDPVARLWDSETGAMLAELRTQDRGIDAAVFSSDGRRLVTTGQPSTAQVWDVETGTQLALLKLGEGVWTSWAAFSPDNQRLLTITAGGNALLWDVETWKQIAVLRSGEDYEETLQMTGRVTRSLLEVKSAAFNSPGDRIVTTSRKEVRVWDAKSGLEVMGFKATTSERNRVRMGRPLRPFGKQLFAISSVSGGSLSSVVTYAALADSQIEKRAINGLGRPPCERPSSNAVEQWFAPFVRGTEGDGAQSPAVRDPHTVAWQAHESWRGCLQVILAGDFLSPVFVSLVSDDLLQIGRRGDRAAALETSWEKRYAEMTRQDRFQQTGLNEVSTLADAMVTVRRRVLDADAKNWLPVLLLNGTSVTTGRRIVASDVKTITRDQRVTASKFDRVFGDTYDLHELLAINSQVSEKEKGDIRLSTGATLSARFPILSPHGNIRSKEDGRIVDRVVDGGYYENFGAITSLEIARQLENYGLKPFVILINNEPTFSGMDCVTDDSSLPHPKPQQTATFSTLSSPLNALLGSGTARASLAAVQLCSEIGSQRFAYISVRPDHHNPRKALSMSWWISMHVQKYLDEQLDTRGINKAAFAKIRRIR